MMTTDPKLNKNERAALALLLLAILTLMAADLLTDRMGGVGFGHLLSEWAVAAGACAGLLLLLRESLRNRRALRASKAELGRRTEEAEAWRRKARGFAEGLSREIDEQLGRWKLTPSEKDVAFLLLKGLSTKEISEARSTAEKTVRAQCVSIYQKSGLGGRSELAAFFLEDLLLPARGEKAGNQIC